MSSAAVANRSRAISCALGDMAILLASVKTVVKNYSNLVKKLQAAHDHPSKKEFALNDAEKRDLLLDRDGLKATFIQKKKAIRTLLQLTPGIPEAAMHEKELADLQERFREIDADFRALHTDKDLLVGATTTTGSRRTSANTITTAASSTGADTARSALGEGGGGAHGPLGDRPDRPAVLGRTNDELLDGAAKAHAATLDKLKEGLMLVATTQEVGKVRGRWAACMAVVLIFEQSKRGRWSIVFVVW